MNSPRQSAALHPCLLTGDEVPAIPRFGETLEEIGKYKKSQLSPAYSLKGLFQKMHNRLYGEGPLKREDAIANEIIKLLFCKLFDELHTPGETCEFRATITELRTPQGQHAIAGRVRGLFSRLKNDPHYRDMFSDEIQYDDAWISYIVSELQAIGLTHDKTDTDAMGDAYEIFVGPQLKGESGQFFTPRQVVRLIINILKPSLVKRESVIDPACGSGGFLTYTLRAAREEAVARYPSLSGSKISEKVREYANNFISGIDNEPLLYKVAKSYMAVVGNGRSGIFNEDSLAQPAKWKMPTLSRVKLNSYDVLVTNPPFGTKIKIESPDILGQYDLAHALKDGVAQVTIRGGQDPSILFLERAYQLLKTQKNDDSGGRMGIVLPRQILSGHDPNTAEIRKWILRHMRILAVIDLPPETFQPYTGTITSLLFAERVATTPADDYLIFMAVAEHVGNDRRGQPFVEREPDGSPKYDKSDCLILRDDLPKIAASYEQFLARNSKFRSNEPSAYSIKVSAIRSQSRCRMDAWYHDPAKNELAKRIWDLDGVDGVSVKTIGDLIARPSDVFIPGRHKRNYCNPGKHAVPFLSGTNILQIRPFDVKWQPREYKPVLQHLVEKGWILVTRSGSTGRVVYIGDDLSGFPVARGVAVTEHAIRIIPDKQEVDPGYLFAFLADDDIGKVLLNQGIYASVVREITPEHIKSIPVPLPPPIAQKAIGDRIRETEAMRCKANTVLRQMQERIGKLVKGL